MRRAISSSDSDNTTMKRRLEPTGGSSSVMRLGSGDWGPPYDPCQSPSLGASVDCMKKRQPPAAPSTTNPCNKGKPSDGQGARGCE
jgi:hypothetical protein